MKDKSQAITAVGAFGFALAFPLAFRAAYGGTFSVPLLVLFIVVKTVVNWLEARSTGLFRYIYIGLSGFLALVYATLVLASIVITPYSSYQFWLENVKFHEAGGTVSNVLVALIAFLSLSISGLLFKGKYAWTVLAMALAISSILAFTYQTTAFLLLVLLVLAVVVGYMAHAHGYRGSRLRSTLSLGGLFASCLVLATIFTGNTQATGSKFVDVTLYPTLRSGVLEVFPRFPLLYAIPGYGYSFNETKRLGGTPILSTAGIFEMTFKDEGRIYLRTRSYDYYDGETWQLSTSVDDSTELGVVYRSPQGEPEEIGLKLLSEYYSMVPHTLDTARVRFDNSNPSLQYGNRAIGMLLEKPIKRDAVFHIQREAEGTHHSLESKSAFLQVPKDIPEEIIDLAKKISSGTSDPETILRRIEQYLAINYMYSLEIEEEGDYSEDFVTDFLFGALQGYCVHFATSFALLARLNDIPTRYVTGFLVHPPSEGERTVEVTGLNAHAWPEVWLDSQANWVAWEATPALNPTNWNFADEAWLYNLGLAGNDLTGQQLRQVMGPLAVPINARGTGFQFPFLWVGTGLALVALVAGVRWLAILLTVLLSHDKRVFLYRLQRMVQIGRRRGVSTPDRTGWVQWSEVISERCSISSRPAGRAVDLITETVYGAREPSRRDIRFITVYLGRLKRSGAWVGYAAD